jgi:hypothetical protein
VVEKYSDIDLKFADLRTRAMADLEEAIQVSRQAVDIVLKDHLEWARRLNSLGCGLSNRYLRTGVIADLEEAIQVSRRAADITPEDYPDR